MKQESRGFCGYWFSSNFCLWHTGIDRVAICFKGLKRRHTVNWLGVDLPYLPKAQMVKKHMVLSSTTVQKGFYDAQNDQFSLEDICGFYRRKMWKMTLRLRRELCKRCETFSELGGFEIAPPGTGAGICFEYLNAWCCNQQSFPIQHD